MTTPLEKFLNPTLSSKSIKAIRDLYSETTNAQQAATAFTSNVNASTNANKAKTQLYGMWWCIKEASFHPELHEKLIELMSAIRFLPDLVVQGETVLKWKEYPGLDAYDLILYRDQNTSYKDNLLYAHETAFVARLSTLRIPHADFLAWSVHDMSSCFENGYIEIASQGEKEACYYLQTLLPHCLQWVVHAGREIYEKCVRVREVEGGSWKKAGKGKVGNKEEDEGFTAERWEVWKEGAGMVAELGKLDKETREAGRKMVEVMERIEREVESEAGA